MKVDLILKNGYYLDNKTNSFIKGDIGIKGGIIVSINSNMEGPILDITDKYVVPSFIDSHIHIESTNSLPKTFSKIVSMHGTGTVIADFHEIINVGGLDALKFTLDETKSLPVSIYHAVASSVPASIFDMHGIKFGPNEIEYAFKDNQTISLGEVMDFTSLLNKDPRMYDEISLAKKYNKVINGHAPGVRGEAFKTYLELSGATDDHECFSYEEALEKLKIADSLLMEKYNCSFDDLKVLEEQGILKRFRIMIRDGGAAKNLKALVPLFNHPEYKDRLIFATDDKEIEELKDYGHIDSIIEKAISYGVNPIDAYNAATINCSNYYNLLDIGSIEVGKLGDLVVLDNPLGNKDKTINIDNNIVPNIGINYVLKKGNVLTNELLDKIINEKEDSSLKDKMTHTMKFNNYVDESMFKIDNPRTIIEVVPNELLTNNYGVTNDYDLSNDILKLVVMDSHNGTGKYSICYVKGIGLKSGAYAGTIAHDSHYLCCVGTNDKDITSAINEIIKMQGGQVYIDNGEIKAKLRLEIAGLMTEAPIEEIRACREKLNKIECNPGIKVTITTQFLSLCVIPSIRMTPNGVVDVLNNKYITQEEMEEEFNNKKAK